MVYLEFCWACNNACINCVVRDFTRPMRSLEDIKRNFPGGDDIQLTGGEPTLHPDFFEIISYVTSKYRDVSLITNARFFHDKENVRKLKAISRDIWVCTTLYGPDKATHEAHAGVECWKETTVGLQNLSKARMKIDARILVTKKNVELLPKIAEFIKANYAVERVSILSMKIKASAYKNRKELFIPLSEAGLFLPETVRTLDSVKTIILNFPHCTTPREVWSNMVGVSAPAEQVHFASCCESCKMRKDCSGLWKTYADFYGEKELKPFH